MCKIVSVVGCWIYKYWEECTILHSYIGFVPGVQKIRETLPKFQQVPKYCLWVYIKKCVFFNIIFYLCVIWIVYYLWVRLVGCHFIMVSYLITCSKFGAWHHHLVKEAKIKRVIYLYIVKYKVSKIFVPILFANNENFLD